ncbi:MAG TPA: hypothetical protein VIK54_06725 [Acidimicrobiia bacterium]
MLFVARGGVAKRESARGGSPAIARPLAIRADGIVDPDKIDLSGLAGVTPAEQVKAENLLRTTILDIQKWSDVARAKADGFVSIGDGFGGTEHYVHWDWINDRVILDPSRPESLVYRVQPDGARILVAVMFILPKQYTLDNTPDIGGNLTQFHVHNNLCFSDSTAPQFRRFARLDGTCIAPLVKLLTTPMIHVWIRPNRCGPFAPIGGLAGGEVVPGERVDCDSAHGGTSTF